MVLKEGCRVGGVCGVGGGGSLPQELLEVLEVLEVLLLEGVPGAGLASTRPEKKTFKNE